MTAYPGAMWAALGDPTRRAIFERLLYRPRAVSELAEEMPVSRPAVSQHLRVLGDAGLVHHRRTGRQHVYHVDREGLAALRAQLDDFWNQSLAAFKDLAEQPPKEGQ